MLTLDHHPSGRHFLQIPGPSPVPDRILRAMSLPTIDHRGPEFGVLQRPYRTRDGHVAAMTPQPDEFAAYLKATKPSDGFTEVLYPGEVEWRTEQARRKSGIEVDAKTWKAFQDLGAKHGIRIEA